VKEEDVEEEKVFELNHDGPPSAITEDDHVEHLMDVPATTKHTFVSPYPKSNRELRRLRYGSVGPSPKTMSRELKGLQRNHVAYVNKVVLRESRDKAYQSKFVMIQRAFNSNAGLMVAAICQKTKKCVKA
jgi:hypothetical protein